MEHVRAALPEAWREAPIADQVRAEQVRTLYRQSTPVLLANVSVVAVVWLFGHLLGMPLPRGPWGF